MLAPLPLHRGAKPCGETGGFVCSSNHPLRKRTGGSGGHFAFGKRAPRRPFCPLSAGGKWTPFSAPAGAEAFPAPAGAVADPPALYRGKLSASRGLPADKFQLLIDIFRFFA